MSAFAYLRLVSLIAALLTVVEGIFFINYSKLWLKRIPNYDHDFLGVWLLATNVVLAFYIGALKVRFESRPDKVNGTPKFR